MVEVLRYMHKGELRESRFVEKIDPETGEIFRVLERSVKRPARADPSQKRDASRGIGSFRNGQGG